MFRFLLLLSFLAFAFAEDSWSILEKKIIKGEISEELIPEIERAAQQGSVKAISYLAGLYYSGAFVERDLTKALYLYQKAADAGYGPAQFHVGIMFMKGEGSQHPDWKQSYLYLMMATGNHKDLDDLTKDAAKWSRVSFTHLSFEERVEIFQKLHDFPQKIF